MNKVFLSQLNNKYVSYLKELISGNAFTPIRLYGGKSKPISTQELHEYTYNIQQYEKKDAKYGWRIAWEEWKSKKFGVQQWPADIFIDTEEDYLFLLKKDNEVNLFKSILTQLLSWQPVLKEWLYNHPNYILSFKDEWNDFISVVDHLLLHDVSAHYIRTIPVPVHTKFIEDNKTIILSLLKFIAPEKFTPGVATLEEALQLKRKPYIFPARWLDASLQSYTPHMAVFGLTTDTLHTANWQIKQIIFVENETNLYMLPAITGTLAICSYGKAVHILKNIPFLQNIRLHYWGDFDEEGFAMLNAIRQEYQHIESLFMDEATILFHSKELQFRKTKYKNLSFTYLSETEVKALSIIREEEKWLEQERLRQDYVQEYLSAYLN